MMLTSIMEITNLNLFPQKQEHRNLDSNSESQLSQEGTAYSIICYIRFQRLEQ